MRSSRIPVTFETPPLSSSIMKESDWHVKGLQDFDPNTSFRDALLVEDADLPYPVSFSST